MIATMASGWVLKNDTIVRIRILRAVPEMTSSHLPFRVRWPLFPPIHRPCRPHGPSSRYIHFRAPRACLITIEAVANCGVHRMLYIPEVASSLVHPSSFSRYRYTLQTRQYRLISYYRLSLWRPLISPLTMCQSHLPLTDRALGRL